MLSSHQYISLSSVLHRLEEAAPPLPASSTVFKLVVFGVPIAVLLHDLSEYYMPKATRWYPVVTFFKRRWVADPTNKSVDLMLFRNIAIFLGIASLLHGGVPRVTPIDYLSDRLTSTTARRNLDRDITSRRSAALDAANQVMAAHAFDEAKARALRQEALDRRQNHQAI